MSSTEDIASLRAELSDLKERVRVLEQLTAARAEGSPSTVVPVTVTYHSAATDSPSAAPPAVTVGSPTQLPGTPVGLTPGGRITASQYTEEYRRDIALGIGDYLRRSLQGVNRGPSGRDLAAFKGLHPGSRPERSHLRSGWCASHLFLPSPPCARRGLLGRLDLHWAPLPLGGKARCAVCRALLARIDDG